jgi:hypothetical protein
MAISTRLVRTMKKSNLTLRNLLIPSIVDIGTETKDKYFEQGFQNEDIREYLIGCCNYCKIGRVLVIFF